MLSIIVSSYQKKYFDQFSLNVKETIGENFQYEIIQIWNPGKMGICEAYNKGAEQAKYDNLLFVHEDVLFETINWGNILIDYLENESIGCVGIAGSSVKTRFPIAWWDLKKFKHVSINQFKPEKDQIKKNRLERDNKIKVLDGVFIAVRKSIWEKYKFNQKANKSFHGYDVEFSLDIAINYQNYVSNKILLTHFSQGSPNKDWFIQQIRIYQKKNLKIDSDLFDLESIDVFFRYMVKYRLTKKEKFKVFISFYNPIKYSFSNNLMILNLFRFYYNKKELF